LTGCVNQLHYKHGWFHDGVNIGTRSSVEFHLSKVFKKINRKGAMIAKLRMKLFSSLVDQLCYCLNFNL